MGTNFAIWNGKCTECHQTLPLCKGQNPLVHDQNHVLFTDCSIAWAKLHSLLLTSGSDTHVYFNLLAQVKEIF